MSHDGYFVGTHILLNTGNASHGGGENRGMSKAACMVGALLILPSQYGIALNWTQAWTPINMRDYSPHLRPILIALAKAADKFFWVSIPNNNV